MRKNGIRYAMLCSENIYTARRRKAPLLLRFGAFMGRRLNFSAGREYAAEGGGEPVSCWAGVEVGEGRAEASGCWHRAWRERDTSERHIAGR